MIGDNPFMGKQPSKKAQPRIWSPALARRVQIAMDAKKMKKADLARAVNVKPPSISGWFNLAEPTAPSVDNLYSMASLFGVSIDWLLGRGPDDFPGIGSDSRPLERGRTALIAAAIIHVFYEMKKLPIPEDLGRLIVRGYDWAEEMEERGERVSFEGASTTIRHMLKQDDGSGASMGTAR